MLRDLIPDVHKIAVVKPSPLGDLIFALPALDALHRAYPTAEITLLGRPWFRELLTGRVPSIARVVTVPPTEGLQMESGDIPDPGRQASFFAAMERERFDLAIQLYGGGKYSNPFTVRLGARISVGAKAEDAPALDRWLPYVYYQNEVIRNLEVVGLAGATAAGVEPLLPVLEGDRRAARQALGDLSDTYVVVHPGCTDVRRRWPDERFAEIIRELAAERGVSVVLTGGGEESDLVSRVARQAAVPTLNLCGRLTLPALLGVLAGARLVITNNTGPLHLALAVGTPAIGLYWVEQSINTLPLTRSRFTPLIAWRRECPLCGKYCDKREFDNPAPAPCDHRTSFLEEIETAQVSEEIDHLLAR